MAKRNTVTYGELVEVLRRLGYPPDPEQSAEGYTVSRHPARRLRIILPAPKGRTANRAIHLVAVRWVLEENGFAEAREFEAWLDSRGIRLSRGLSVS